jgi:photosystem II stability/assembly factor-like uncharacterized protein
VFKHQRRGGWNGQHRPDSHFVYALAVNPQTLTILYAGHGEACIKSTDSGGSWEAANTGLTNFDLYAVVIDPLAPETLYAGTFGGGVFKSINGGGNWSQVNTDLTGTFILSLAIDPVTPTTLYAGTWGSGVFRSERGRNWSQSTPA